MARSASASSGSTPAFPSPTSRSLLGGRVYLGPWFGNPAADDVFAVTVP